MHSQNLQVGVPFEHAVEDQVVQRNGRVERIADHVVEVEAREPLGVGEAVGMDDDERAERLGLLPERGEVRLRELPARNVGQDLRAFHAERRHAALELVRRFRAVKQRHGAERDEAVGLARHVFSQPSFTMRAALTAMSSGTV